MCVSCDISWHSVQLIQDDAKKHDAIQRHAKQCESVQYHATHYKTKLSNWNKMYNAAQHTAKQNSNTHARARARAHTHTHTHTHARVNRTHTDGRTMSRTHTHARTHARAHTQTKPSRIHTNAHTQTAITLTHTHNLYSHKGYSGSQKCSTNGWWYTFHLLHKNLEMLRAKLRFHIRRCYDVAGTQREHRQYECSASVQTLWHGFLTRILVRLSY